MGTRLCLLLAIGSWEGYSSYSFLGLGVFACKNGIRTTAVLLRPTNKGYIMLSMYSAQHGAGADHESCDETGEADEILQPGTDVLNPQLAEGARNAGQWEGDMARSGVERPLGSQPSPGRAGTWIFMGPITPVRDGIHGCPREGYALLPRSLASCVWSSEGRRGLFSPLSACGAQPAHVSAR